MRCINPVPLLLRRVAAFAAVAAVAALAPLLAIAAAAPAAPAEPVPRASVRLYAMDCGHLSISDMGMFSDTDDLDGQPGEMAVPCFLIRHPQGDLVWDAGLGDALAGRPGGVVDQYGITATVTRTLVSQLAALGLQPGDIRYLGLSHLHGDHTGNANLFTRATWLLQRDELAWALRMPSPAGVAPATFDGYRRAKVELLDGDHDAFGDGTVRILRTPGHTAGHDVLVLRLAHSGTVILSGDLYHSRGNHAHRRVPVHNDSRADTLASFDRVATLVKQHRARLVIQHSPEDVAGLPVFPKFLD